ncbi:FMN reductase, partial [Mesorhizobium sp. M7A.F.Ca.CA.002.05.1.1]
SPTYKGSYTGLFKHFFDLIDPAALRGKPIVLTATGGGERHALIVEHQLRPLFGFFEAFALPTAVYATDKDFTDGVLRSEAILKRVAQAVDEVGFVLANRSAGRIAAE